VPGLFSEIALDSLGIRNASEAFLGGTVPDAGSLAKAAGDFGNVWAADPINGAFVVAATIIGIFSLNLLYTLIPYLFGALTGWKATARLNQSMRLSRERNILFHLAFLPFCLISSRFSLYHIGIMDGMPPHMVTLISLGVAFIYLGVRQLLAVFFAPSYCMEQWKIAKTNLPNGFILITLLAIIYCGIAAFAGIPDDTSRRVLLYIAAIVFIVIFYRNFEILSWKGRRFKGFLYLCALELAPSILLVASAIIF